MLGSFADAAVQRCPFPLIQALHRDAPVYLDPVTGLYVVSRYDDIAYVSAHPELFSNKTTLIMGGDETAPNKDEIAAIYATEGWPRIHTLVTNDPPSHGRYRTIVDKVFSPSFVKQLEPYITALCDELIDDFIGGATADLHQDYCVKIPMFVISDQLGVPREKWRTFKLWSDTVIALINPALDPDERLRLVKIHVEMQQYLALRQAEYQAAPIDNLLSRLAVAEIDGDRLSTTEFISVAENLLVAGNETTTGGIAHAIAKLIREPDLMEELRASPEKIGPFVEEVLRMHAPSPHLYRQVLVETELSGVKLAKGSLLMLSYLAANHDPEKYTCPEQIDLARPGIKNHLAFGRGIHFCIGNQLARSEMRIAVARLLARIDNIAFDPAFAVPQIAANYHIHQLDSLRIEFQPKREMETA